MSAIVGSREVAFRSLIPRISGLFTRTYSTTVHGHSFAELRVLQRKVSDATLESHGEFLEESHTANQIVHLCLKYDNLRQHALNVRTHQTPCQLERVDPEERQKKWLLRPGLQPIRTGSKSVGARNGGGGGTENIAICVVSFNADIAGGTSTVAPWPA